MATDEKPPLEDDPEAAWVRAWLTSRERELTLEDRKTYLKLIKAKAVGNDTLQANLQRQVDQVEAEIAHLRDDRERLCG